ncbi:MAG: right-handed parallel beta-helix repeat-containing protein, partial [Anaerolineaceae bacterium]|nr:right-handed parallel beta-helix repeat-containing protein [Anaerolineaceae bacterium]
MRRMRVFVWLPTLIALSLLAALFITTPVHAQDEQPPEPEQAPAEAVVDSPPEEEIPAAELVPALESAAETLATGDPWYKVGTKTYHFLSGVLPNTCANLYPGDPYCFQSTTPITAAVDYITTSGLPSDGVIYVETGSYTSESIFVDAAITPVYAGFKGLIGTVVDNLPTVNYAGDLNIKGVGLGFNIKGFKMTGGSGISIQNSKGTIKIEDVEVRQTTSGPGIEIKNHNGAVLLNRVDAHDDLFCGASIDNSAGSAGVTITNSSFDENHTENMLFRGGLIITTKGAIKIHGISASRNLNNKSGLWIARSGSITIEDSIFNNNARAIANDDFTPPTASIILNNVYAQNNNAGILLFTKGNITLTGVHSEKNIDGGAFDTCYVNGTPACTWLGSGVVTIIESTFDTNTGYGLNVTARGAITLTNVSVSGNTGNGAYLDTSWSQLASAVTINNDAFNSNGGDGLMILAKGAVNMNKVHAGDYDSYTGSPRGNAGGFGAYINNTFGTAGVTIKGATFGDNQFWYNGMTGLYIESRGTISAAFIEASENDWNGAVLDNSPGKGSIVLSGSNYANKFERNGTSAGYMGLMILSKGSVLLDGIYANDNSSSGLSYSSPSNTNSTTIKNGIFGCQNILYSFLRFGRFAQIIVQIRNVVARFIGMPVFARIKKLVQLRANRIFIANQVEQSNHPRNLPHRRNTVASPVVCSAGYSRIIR